ncbi:MAG: Dabb family protein [Muribaculaceae bacterium]|nr:Dabb family protein [Muribaculaceae bacterium]
MVKHIVMFRLNAEGEKLAQLAGDFKKAIEALPAKIEALKLVEVGINDGPAQGNWHIVLTAICDDYQALDTYSAHPEHLACVAIIKADVASRACVDYLE